MSIDTQHFFNITRIVAFTFILLVLTTAAIAARGDDRLSEEELFSLAVHFFKNKDYGTAAVELNKFLYLFPDSENAEKAKYLIGVSYFNNKNYSKALNHFFSTA
jgi:TolA-binding protein